MRGSRKSGTGRGFRGKVRPLAVLWILLTVSGLAQDATPGFVPVLKFDPKRDAVADLNNAIAEAHRTGKRVLVDVGGDWCRYCVEMDALLKEHPELVRLRDEKFVPVAIYYKYDQKNERALEGLPKPVSIPEYYVLDGDGKLLHAQPAIELRTKDAYDPKKLEQFLQVWSQVTKEL